MRSVAVWVSAAAGLVAAGLAAPSARAATATRAVFGSLRNGTKIEAVTLSNAHGMTAHIMTLGADLQSLEVADRNGHSANVVLGYPDPQKYLDFPNYFGASVGRYANRIANATFKLDGKTYHLDKNDHGNSLHGGFKGFDKQVWKIVSVKSGKQASVTLSYLSPAGQGGYPGDLHVTATYALSDDEVLSLTYTATTDAPTVLNISNHSFWNLRGEASGHDVMDEHLTIYADAFTPVDETLIPTGEIRNVAGTPYDFRDGETIGSRIHDGHSKQLLICRGYDENYVLNSAKGVMHPAARLEDPATGRVMEIDTNQPGLQLYTGNFLDGSVAGTSDHIYRQTDAVVMEPQHFPNAPNEPKFASTTLTPGQTYVNEIQYRFSTVK
ncbi:MAG: aldose epimerase family protein [Steroidobacteraceae bacterium]